MCLVQNQKPKVIVGEAGEAIYAAERLHRCDHDGGERAGVFVAHFNVHVDAGFLANAVGGLTREAVAIF